MVKFYAQQQEVKCKGVKSEDCAMTPNMTTVNECDFSNGINAPSEADSAYPCQSVVILSKDNSWFFCLTVGTLHSHIVSKNINY